MAFVPYWSSLRSLGQYIVLEFDNRHDSLISRKPEVHVMTEKGRALWVLAFLSPIIAELLSGSSPPLEFFNPISFALLLGLYGAGVLVVRELAVMWRLGWMGIIVLGAAYGILEEGVAIKSFFDPFWMDLGGLGEYGRYVGTNWVWAVWLTIYHSMISITLPILITWLLYPNLRNTRLTNFSSFGALLVILLLDVVVCTLLLNRFVPFIPMWLLAVAAVFGLTYYAKHIPRGFMMPREDHPTWSPFKFAVLGFLMISLDFLLAGAFAGTSVPPIVPVILMLVVAAFTVTCIRDFMGRGNNEPQVAAFISGPLAFFVVLGLFLELGGILGMSVVAIVTAVFIVDLNRWARGRKVIVFRVWKLLHGRRVSAPVAVTAWEK